jgi:dihydroorotase
LQEAMKQGKITFIGTDHAPHSLEEKMKPFLEAPSGFGALDFYVPYFLTQIFNGFLNLPDFVKYSSFQVAKSFNLTSKGRLEKQFDADIVIFKKVRPYNLKVDNFLSKSRVCPYDLNTLQARIMQVFLDGKLVVNNDPVLIEKYPILKNQLNKREGKFIKKS